jgi:uncharacterized membrane protein YgcG
VRFVRLLGAVLTILTAGLLLVPAAGTQPPSKYTDHVIDTTGVLTDSGRAAVSSAIDRLYQNRHANRASTLAAEAQTLANAQVLAAQRRRGTAPTR